MGKRGGSSSKDAGKRPRKSQSNQGTLSHKGKRENLPQRPDTALAIDFGENASILRKVETLTDEEMRPVDLQVLYMLKIQIYLTSI